MRALIVGAGGQLGRALCATVPVGWTVSPFGREALDITSTTAVARVVDSTAPAVVINAAAYNAVDRAESEPDRAYAANADGPENLARVSAACGARLVHVSTDYVFDGRRSSPYPPEAAVNPLSVYGASKLAGEQRVLEHTGDAVVVRTAWVHSAGPQNFVTAMLRLLRERGEIAVVADQVGAPTWARALARVIWGFACAPTIRGLFHWSDAGVASRYDEAVAVLDDARAAGLLPAEARVRPIRSADYPTAARRPSYSVLDSTATVAALGIEQEHWRVGIRADIAELALASRAEVTADA